MAYQIYIRKNATGEVRVYSCPDLDWEEHSLGWWTEGNMGCDCNRHLCFERAGGREPAWNEGSCGETAYAALFAELADGSRIELY